jgi:hypothetical protein
MMHRFRLMFRRTVISEGPSSNKTGKRNAGYYECSTSRLYAILEN